VRAIPVASVCRLTSVGVAQCLRTLAPINPVEVTGHPVGRTFFRLTVNDPPVRGGMISLLLTTGGMPVTTV